ncbi:hypothetical protein [Bacillus massilinigeriensis]|uniref:hypothetical protein n=1 Tax=Bacillus mediterraneensis TaxID=1805474 RepID=UPI0008F8C7F0|nr:hypothetical protein [Bacillus mediterraneensis]
MIKKLLIAVLAIGILSACGGEDKVVEEKIKKEAVRYTKENEKETFIPERIEYPDAPGGGFCFVYGHYESDPDKEISVSVSYDPADEYYHADSVAGDSLE